MSAEIPISTPQDVDPQAISQPKPRKRILSGGGGLALLGVGAALAGCGGGSPGSVNGESTGSHPASGTPVPEIADNHRGTQLFGSPEGAAVADGVPGEIEYGARVLVRCYVPNRSDMSSINDFYLIVAPEDLRGTYAPANTFANGGPMGPNSETIDPRVPEC
jgi:hypothetical protein